EAAEADVAAGILPAVEGGHLAARMGVRRGCDAVFFVSDRVAGSLVPPGWKPRLYGRQDACHHRAGFRDRGDATTYI
ncbi:MAG: hypothetical protein EBS05_08910, partial [Proteobacteria bacterium]|nr:hypothetical protein [Pseudomonadota bacterium]